MCQSRTHASLPPNNCSKIPAHYHSTTDRRLKGWSGKRKLESRFGGSCVCERDLGMELEDVHVCDRFSPSVLLIEGPTLLPMQRIKNMWRSTELKSRNRKGLTAGLIIPAPTADGSQMNMYSPPTRHPPHPSPRASPGEDVDVFSFPSKRTQNDGHFVMSLLLKRDFRCIWTHVSSSGGSRNDANPGLSLPQHH